MAEGWVERFEAVTQAEDFGDAVSVMSVHDEVADDVIEPGTNAAAGDDAEGGVGGVKVDLFAWAGEFYRGEGRMRGTGGRDGREVVVEKNALGVVHPRVGSLAPGFV